MTPTTAPATAPGELLEESDGAVTDHAAWTEVGAGAKGLGGRVGSGPDSEGRVEIVMGPNDV